MAACVFAAPTAVRIFPLRGSIALRMLPEHVAAPLLHPAMYSTCASLAFHLSGKKFDICPNWSYCGC